MIVVPRPLSEATYRAAILAVGEGGLFPRLREFELAQWAPPDELLENGRGALREILSHARDTCPFYADRIPDLGDATAVEDLLGQIPLLEKHHLQKHSESMRSRNHTGRVSHKTTGGSTGEPVTVIKDRRATAAERAAMWLAYGWFDVRMGDRAARFWGSPYTWKRKLLSRLADIGMNRIRFSAFEFDDSKLDEYWRRLQAFDPDYVHGYVSMLEQMARHALDHDAPRHALRLKSVIATSEVLSPPQRAVIEEAFGAPVQVEYGCGELGPIAHECPKGNLHLMTPNLWVEVLAEDGTPAPPGEPGEVVLTDLHNRAMPLVRYRIGDRAVRGGECPCGRSLPVLEKVWGRAYDFVRGPDGRRYHGEFFMYVFEDLRSSGTPIGQFQVIQEAPDSLRILLTSDEEVTVETREKVIGTVARRLPGISIQLEQVARIPRTSSGKMQVIKGLGASASENGADE